MSNNNKITRVARVLVTVDEDWLQGDYPEEFEESIKQGWEQIETTLLSIRSEYNSYEKGVTASFIEWEPPEDPPDNSDEIEAVFNMTPQNVPTENSW